MTVVLDSGGIGAVADFATFGDAPGANTIANVAARAGGLRLPNLERLGLGSLTSIAGVSSAANPAARVARLRPLSAGKDTITGHWEMAGILTATPFPTFPGGFPPEVVEAFEAIVGGPVLGNVPASGTEIIHQLGPKHLATGQPILYTSADSVFQVAAHEEVVPLPTLYEWCERARDMLVAPHNVNRVIARPFLGKPGAFSRTPNRRDYAIEPPPSLLDELGAGGIEVYAVGKICDIYCGHGMKTSVRTANNRDAILKTADFMTRAGHGFIFTNLNDFDSSYGHRRDVRGYAMALEEFDAAIPQLESLMRPGDHLILTADHGCDPTAPGTDHTREFVPFVHVGPHPGAHLGTLDGLDTVGRAVSGALGIS